MFYNIIMENTVITNNQQAVKVDTLASQIIPGQHLESFKSLPLADKVLGLEVFAAIGGDAQMLAALQSLKKMEVA
jgi:hypothetical protein